MKHFIKIFLAVILIPLIFSCKSQNKENNKPNVVLVMADDMGYECLGCNGSTEYQTPVLDNLAGKGIRFEHCYSQPLCTPSRVKIMTGKFNFRNYEDFGYLNPDEKTFGNLLKDAGYATCIAGKWQLNGLNRDNPGNQDVTRPYHFGFDEYCLWQLNRKRSEGERFANPLITQNGEDLPRDPDAYGPQIFSDYITDFIDRKAGEPFFIYYPMVMVHNPFVPTPDSPEWSDESRRYEKDTAYFADMMAYTDKIIGQIVNKLKEKEVWGNTLLIFTADNGTNRSVISSTIYGNIIGGKGKSVNTGNHVPMVITWPEIIDESYVFTDIIDFTDILPTLSDVSGIDPSSYVTDGKSFYDVLTGDKKRPGKKEIFIHYTPRWGSWNHSRWVMDGMYKLYRDDRFYNTSEDPDEKHEIKNPTEEEQKIRSRFKSILQDKEKEFPFNWNDESFKKEDKEVFKPNIIILMSDNQSWNHLGCYGDPALSTPNIDKLAKEGIRFNHAFCSAPSCSPARASMLTGQDMWRLEEAANLWGSFPDKFKVYTEMLENQGYLVGFEGKGWGPGNYEDGGWERNPAGDRYNSFEEFYNNKEKGQPFCYWFSSRDPHRPYKVDGWQDPGIDINKIEVPPYLPDIIEVKKDIGDYYAEIQDFDRDVGSYLQLLQEMGEVNNTLIIVCSDNGWQMPRGLANLYDFGTRIPLVISMPSKYKGGRVVDDFVSLNDFAPTFLELAGMPIPEEMNANSFLNILESEEEGYVDKTRSFMVTGRERHAFVRKGGAGYGARAYRTRDFLYIRNYDHERWPAGDPPLYGDVDAHMLHYPCPTKMYLLKNRDEKGVKELFDMGFGKRPAEELYDLRSDPFQLNNVAYSEEYKEEKKTLSNKLTEYLKNSGDPRELGLEMKWINAPYYAEKDKRPEPGEEAIKELNLEKEYSYIEE